MSNGYFLRIRLVKGGDRTLINAVALGLLSAIGMSGTYLKLPPWAKTAVRRHPFIVGLLGAPVGIELAGGTLAALISVGLLGILVQGIQYLPVLKDTPKQSGLYKNSSFKPRPYRKAA